MACMCAHAKATVLSIAVCIHTYTQTHTCSCLLVAAVVVIVVGTQFYKIFRRFFYYFSILAALCMCEWRFEHELRCDIQLVIAIRRSMTTFAGCRRRFRDGHRRGLIDSEKVLSIAKCEPFTLTLIDFNLVSDAQPNVSSLNHSISPTVNTKNRIP